MKDDYETTFVMMEGFLEDELFAAMYEGGVKEITVAERMIETRGALGVLLIGILILVPVCLIFSGVLKRWFGRA